MSRKNRLQIVPSPSTALQLINKMKIAHRIYLRTVSSQHLLFALLNWFNQFMGCMGRARGTIHTISAHIVHEIIQFTKAKELLRSYCPNIHTYCEIAVSNCFGILNQFSLFFNYLSVIYFLFRDYLHSLKMQKKCKMYKTYFQYTL